MIANMQGCCYGLRLDYHIRFLYFTNYFNQKCYVSANIFLKFSGLENTNNKPFSNTFGKSSTTILTELLSTEDIINAPINELINFLLTYYQMS